jgi:ATPase subunit of ABC transporter with duplicated ATPase domains
VEELTAPEVSTQQVLQYFIEKLESQAQLQIDEGSARSFLGSFGLKGQIVINPIGTLSGGQKVRLALALIVFPAPDLLVLDEVSTHLDMVSSTAAL